MYINIDYFYYQVYSFFTEGYEIIFGGSGNAEEAFFWMRIISFLISMLFLAGIIYSFYGISKLKKKQFAEFIESLVEEPPAERKTKWDKIKSLIESNNSSEWRMAVLEADSLIDDIIRKAGYKGDTFGERLSGIKPYQLKSINEIWEAHKIRNRIAHEGSRYNLTKREAEQALDFFETALKELGYLS